MLYIACTSACIYGLLPLLIFEYLYYGTLLLRKLEVVITTVYILLLQVCVYYYLYTNIILNIGMSRDGDS